MTMTNTYNMKQNNDSGIYELENGIEINWRIALLLIAIFWGLIDPLNLMASLMLVALIAVWELLKLFTPDSWIEGAKRIFFL